MDEIIIAKPYLSVAHFETTRDFYVFKDKICMCPRMVYIMVNFDGCTVFWQIVVVMTHMLGPFDHPPNIISGSTKACSIQKAVMQLYFYIR